MRLAVLLLLALVALAPALAASAPTAGTLVEPVLSAPATPAAVSATAPGIRLSEVLIHPADGKPDFVELLNTGAIDAMLDGLTLINERDQTVALPDGLAPLAVGAVLLVVFDGEKRGEDSALHAAPTDFLALDSGAVELRGTSEAVLDAVAWGTGQPAAVNLGRGGLSALPSELAPGSSIGRAPGTTRRGPLEWTLFGPEEASPGAPNPQPGVTVLLPLTGTILDSPLADLSWYPVPGATEYRVQLTAETDPSFASPLVDATAPEPSLVVDLLPPGRYRWRVQAIGASGDPAPFSPAQSLVVDPAFAPGAAALRAMPAALVQADQAGVVPVPLLAQRKDTKMLLIEEDVAEGGEHAWDKNHAGTDMGDPADNMNCALAVAAMINAYKGGQLSQDRIGFHVRGGGGPEGDLFYGQGLPVNEFARILEFALGVVPARFDVAGQGPEAREYFWDWVVAEIDAKRPLAVAIPGHAVVVVGYIVIDGERILLINQPVKGKFEPVGFETFPVQSYYLTPLQVYPRSDEPGVAADSDSDGVVDFDESKRFGTDPATKDFDGDKVPDKAEIRASMFDKDWGYAIGTIRRGRPDFDGDGLAMEKDKDSDDFGGATGQGGCPDGVEDAKHYGVRDTGETSNFDPDDDRCLHARQVYGEAAHATHGPYEGVVVEHEWSGEIVLEAWVTDVGEGRMEGTAAYTGELTWNAIREAPICGTTTYQHTQTFAGQDLTVSGTRQGDRVELVFAGEVRYTQEGTVAGEGCATEPVAVDMTYDAADFPALTGDLVDGRYEHELVTDYPVPESQGTVTVHTLIEQKGQDEEGAPVG